MINSIPAGTMSVSAKYCISTPQRRTSTGFGGDSEFYLFMLESHVCLNW